MLEPRQIREPEFLKNGIKRRAMPETKQFLQQCADTVEQLLNENSSVRAENVELSENGARMSELLARHESDKNELLARLSEQEQELRDYRAQSEQVSATLLAARKSADEIVAEAERGTQGAKDRAAAIMAEADAYALRVREQASRDYATAVARADASITQKTMAFENFLSSQFSKWDAADRQLQELKKQISVLGAEMPDGLGGVFSGDAKAVWERITGASDNQ